MSSSSSAVTAQYVAEVQEVTTNITLGIVIAALLLYDVLLTSGQEYQYIWRSQKSSFSRILYMWNSPAASCTSLVWLTNVLVILNLIGPAMFTTLRIYALSRKNRILGGVALVLSMAPFLINASTAYTQPPINLPAPLNCTATSMTSRSLNIGPELHTDLYGFVCFTGIVYFWFECSILVSMNVVDFVLVILSIAVAPGSASSYILDFIDPISSILNSRFLLTLHETNTQLEGAADVSISSLSLNTGSGGEPQAGSPELPEYLSVIGGSIRSFHDDEDDLQSLEFAPLQAEEHQPEPEREIQEIRRDGVFMA
ncbi:hypothetical protein VTO73DRAFT_13920 [Trametes versicolor]